MSCEVIVDLLDCSLPSLDSYFIVLRILVVVSIKSEEASRHYCTGAGSIRQGIVRESLTL